MKTEIEASIKKLLARIDTCDGGNDGDNKAHIAMQYAQAALNLAHTAQVLKQSQ